MYAGSLVKIFETSLGPSFQNQTGYTYVGEGKSSVQIANLIIDGLEIQMSLLVRALFQL